MAHDRPEGETFTLAGQVSRMWQDLYLGNGRLPMTTRVQTIEDGFKEIKEGQKWVIRLLIGGIILAVLNLVIHK